MIILTRLSQVVKWKEVEALFLSRNLENFTDSCFLFNKLQVCLVIETVIKKGRKGIMKKLAGKIKHPFIRNVLIMVSGTAAAQVIAMLLSPVITRLYGPENYGIMGTFVSMIGIFVPVAALTYPIAIVLPEDDRDARGIAHLSVFVTLAMTVLSAFIFIIFREPVIEVFNIEEIGSYLFLIPVAIFFGGLLQVMEQWLIRTKQFQVSARTSVVQALLVHGGKAGFGFIYPHALVLVLFSTVQDGLRSFLMYRLSRRAGKPLTFNLLQYRPALKKLAKKHYDFPVFRAPQVFLNAVSQSIPVLMLTSLFSPAAAGFYSIGRTVLNVPSALIGKSVGDVFYPRISEAANCGEPLTRLVRKATLSLAFVGLVPYGLVILFGPWLFAFVFGSEWTLAGEYARWLSLWILFAFMNQPSVRALPVLHAQSFHLVFTIFQLAIRILALAAGYFLFKSDLTAVALYGITGAMLNLLLIVITLRLCGKFDQKREMEAAGDERNE